MDLSGKHDADFIAAVTDSGVCDVYNGNAMANTYTPSPRMDELDRSLDARPSGHSTQPKKISSTGQTGQKVFWLNVADNSLRSRALGLPRRRGSAVVAINEWVSFHSVRTRHFEILAGQDVTVNVRPTQHVATERFAKLTALTRQCLFPHETVVII